MELPAPILLIGDDPSQTSGLARILRDLGTLLSGMPEFRVASLGWHGMGSARLPWPQYHMDSAEFGEYSLPSVWDEFSKGKIGVVLVIWDATRATWLARPEYCEIQSTRRWLEEARGRKFQLWLYSPFDAVGPGNKFTTIVKETLLGVDRILVPSPVALDWVRNTIGAEEAEKRGAGWLPHGLNTRVFTPGDTAYIHTLTRDNTSTHEKWCASRLSTGLESNAGTCTCRATIGTNEGRGGHDTINGGVDSCPVCHTDRAGSHPYEPPHYWCKHPFHEQDVRVVRVGCVMTNQIRKDWGVAAATCAGLTEHLKGRVKFWWHCDVTQRHWSLEALIADYALGEYVELTSPPCDDRWLAEQYRRCDVTFLPSTGEGFGYCLFESLACGTPVIHGNYAGGASLMDTCNCTFGLVQPRYWRIEGVHNCVRPVYEANDFVNFIMTAIGAKRDIDVSRNVQHLGWDRLGHSWKRWFREGL